MNKNVLLLLSFVMFSTIIGMDPRIKAQLARYEREQSAFKKAEEEKKRKEVEQWEREQAAQKKNNEDDAYAMSLTNGYKLSLNAFLNECSDLENLRKNNYEIFAELVKKSCDSNYCIEDESIMEYLTTQWFIVPYDGKVQQTIRNIILCGVHEHNGTYMLYDPSSIKKDRHLLDPELGAIPASK